MNNNKTSGSVVQDFFQAFSQGQADKLTALFDPRAVLYAVRTTPRGKGQLYGQYQGPDGLGEFLGGLGGTFDTKEFVIDAVVSEGELAFASGRFKHIVKATGKAFVSEWALRCVVRNGLITEYRFYEDSAAFVQAASS